MSCKVKGVVPVPDTKLSGGGCSHEVNQLDFSWFPTFQLPRSREESETVQTQPCYGALASKHCQIAWSESIFSSPIMKNRATIGWRTPLSKDQNWKQKISPTLWRKCFRMPVWASKSVEWLRRSLILSVSTFSGIQSKKSCYICVANTTFQRPKLKIKNFPNALAKILSNAGLIIKIDRVVAKIFDSFRGAFSV